MSNHTLNVLNSCVSFVQSGLPHPCLLCGATTRGDQLCPGCRQDLPVLPPQRCSQCALPLPSRQEDFHGGVACGACLRRPPAFDHTVAVYAYDFPLDALVKHFKYQGALELAAWFAQGLAQQALGHNNIDLLIPMPLHAERLGERGFNQAAEIARHLAKHLQLPWLPSACQRIRNTPPQAGLDLKARRRNLRGAFRCDVDLSGMRVALVDDVMTSGTSLNELARTVKKAGAASVAAWVVARTL